MRTKLSLRIRHLARGTSLAALAALLVAASELSAQDSRPASRPSRAPVLHKGSLGKDKAGTFRRYGADLSKAKIQTVTVRELVTGLDKLVGKTVRVTGRVEQTCAKKGCWMWVYDPSGVAAKKGGAMHKGVAKAKKGLASPEKVKAATKGKKAPASKFRAFVRFKDYKFFVPTKGAETKALSFEGVVKLHTMSVKEARHYAEDAGDHELAKKITKPVQVPFVMATGVRIYDPPKKKPSSRPASRRAPKKTR